MQQENNTKLIISRLKDAFSLENNQKLAELLGVNESTIRSWISRDSADLKLIVAICSEKDISFILTGKTAPNSAPISAPNSAPNYSKESKNISNSIERVESFPSDGNPTCLNCKKLEGDIFFLQDTIKAKNLTIVEKEEKIDNLNRQIGRLEGENERLREEIAHYEVDLGNTGT